MMFKSDLRTGMMVKLRGYTDLYVVMLNVEFGSGMFTHDALLVNADGWMPLSRYKNDMTYPGDDEFDIVEVWKPIQSASLRIPCGTEAMDFKSYYEQIYVREDEPVSDESQDCKVIEITMREILNAIEPLVKEKEQKFGVKIKVVSNESEESIISSEVSSTDI